MSAYRKTIFSVGEIYHVFNRGIDKRDIFIDINCYKRATEAIKYYQYIKTPLKISTFLKHTPEFQLKLMADWKLSDKHVDIIAYCLMPNHFHFLLRQRVENGVSTFISNFSNSYTRYFNTRNKRIGSLCEGVFKAIRIITEEQLIHVSRYIHLNPTSSLLVKKEYLDKYNWSSLPEYLTPNTSGFCDKTTILNLFPSANSYRKFVYDQIDYAQKLNLIKHITYELD